MNNNSSDQTAERAQEALATVLKEEKQGYGYACLKGLEYVSKSSPQPDIIVFIDADYSDYPEEITKLVDPIVNEGYHMVIGSRALGQREKGSMNAPQRFGNWLATRLIDLFYGVKYTDLGPFRAIEYQALVDLNMEDRTYGWTVEMQLKAAKQGMKVCEVPVSYRRRIGKSKISGTVKGVVLAGYKIIWTIFRYL